MIRYSWFTQKSRSFKRISNVTGADCSNEPCHDTSTSSRLDIKKTTHHFKVARGNNQVVDDVVDLCDQGQDGGLQETKGSESSWDTELKSGWCQWMDLLCGGGAQVLVSFQQTLAEGWLIRRRFYSGERHLTLTTWRTWSTSVLLVVVRGTWKKSWCPTTQCQC